MAARLVPTIFEEAMLMGYRVNVDYRTAKIHTVNNYKRCQPRPKDPKAGEWLGPFATKEEAKQAGRDRGRQITLCGVCKP